MQIIRASMPFALMSVSLFLPAAVTTDWNEDNVMVVVAADGSGSSQIFDRPATEMDAISHGEISFDGEEGFAPGMEVVTDTDPGIPPSSTDVFNCLMAVAVVSCNGGQQEGKRFKLNRTGFGPIDLVYTHDPAADFTTPGNDGRYRAFMKYANLTGSRIAAFDLQLGFGIGSDFNLSSQLDALAFVDFGTNPAPNELSALFPNGLFGPGTLPGYFSSQRAGFNLQLTDEDLIASTALFGPYFDLFGAWMPLSEVPEGYFYDDDGNPATDNILLAHFDINNDQWIQNRNLDMSGTVSFIAAGNDGIAHVDLTALETALINSSGLSICPVKPDGDPCLAGTDLIEDLSKFNVTMFIDSLNFVDASQFTLRITASEEIQFKDGFEDIPERSGHQRPAAN